MNKQNLPALSSTPLHGPGQRLRWHRLHLGLSQEALAETIGASARSIRRWEQDQAVPQEVMRTRLGQLFGIDPKHLFADSLLEETSPLASSPWLMPFPRNPFFTGREELLHSLRERMSREQNMALTQSWAMSGLGGIGKTQIALEYAYRYRQDYAAVFWINAATQETLQAGLVTLAELLRLSEKNEHDHTRITRAIKRWLATYQNWLLILDNADEVTLVRDILPVERCGHMLLTTRAQALGSLAQRIEVETMGMAEGTLFLLRRSRRLSPEAFLDQAEPAQLAAAEAIVIEMDFLPLALDQAGAYIEEVGCSLSTYLDLYRLHRTELLRRRGHMPGDYPESVATTWSLNFQQVEKTNPAAAELLRLCAFLEPDAIPEELISESGAILGPLLHHAATDALRLNEAIEELRKFSLIQRDPETRLLRLHRLVQAVLKDTMETEEQCQWAERAVRATSTAFPQTVELATWPRCLRFLPQAQVCSKLIRDYGLVFAEAAALLCRSADYVDDASLYEQAEALYQQSLAIWDQAFEPNHAGVAASLTGLARLYDQLGKYEQAEPLYRRVLSIREQFLGADHPGMAHLLHWLAMFYTHQGKYDQAKPLYQQALLIREQVLGPDHPDVAITLAELGNMLVTQGKYDQAESLAQRAVRIWQQAPGPVHPRMAYSLTGLGILFAQQGKYEQAEGLFQQALRIREQTLGLQHADVAESLNNLATLYEDQGRFAEAEGLYQRAISIWEQTLGFEHPYLAYPLKGLADLCQKQGQYEQAEPLYRRALHIWERAFGPEHRDVAQALHGLANLYSKRGMYRQAESLYRRTLSIREQSLGEQHPETAEILQDFAAFQEAQGKFQEAAGLYQRALAIREQVFGAEHPKIEEARTAYVALLQRIANDGQSNERNSPGESSETGQVGNSAEADGEWCGDTLVMPPCPHCQNQTAVSKHGTNRSGTRRFRCRSCSCSFTPHSSPQGYDSSLKEQAVALGEQGKSSRSIARTLGVDHHTVRRWIQAARAEQPGGKLMPIPKEKEG